MLDISQKDLEEVFITNIEKNNIDKVKKYLSSGINVDAILHSRQTIWDTNYFSILALASFAGSAQIVDFLIEKGANVNQMDCLKYRTALHWAVASDNDEIVRVLLNAGANVNISDRDSVTPLMLASNLGNSSIVHQLIASGSNVNHVDRIGTTALHYACMRFHFEIAHKLIVNGCSSNTNTPFSFTSPLKYLLCDKQYYVAKRLVEAGCDLSNEKWILTDERQIIKSNKSLIVDERILNWIRSHAKRPPALRNLCRQTIRKSLGGIHLHKKLSMMNIPKELILYLQMK